MSWKVNGASTGTFTYTGGNPSIGDVVIGANKLDGNFSDFSLAAVVTPEPASVAVLGLGVLGFAFRRRTV